MERNFGTGNRKTRYVLRLEREKVALDFFRFFSIFFNFRKTRKKRKNNN